MAHEDVVNYLANVVLASRADGVAHHLEEEAIEQICQWIGASRAHLDNAIKAVEGGSHTITPVGRFSDRVRNLEDMIYMSVSDGQLPSEQKKVILEFAKTIQVTQPQINRILAESRHRVKLQKGEAACGSCAKEVPASSRFCPFCGCKC